MRGQHRIIALSAGLLVAAGAGIRAVAARDAGSSPAERLARRAAGPTPMLDDLRDLCTRIGGRPTGTPACERAVEWAVARFRAAGVDSVTTESFTIPHLWLPVKAEAACVAPQPFAIRLAAAPYSPSTPAGLEARLVDAGDGGGAAFARLGKSARGAVALIHSGEMETPLDLATEYFRDPGLMRAAQKARVTALLLQSNRPGGTLYRHMVSLSGTIAPIPAAVVSRDDADRLAGLAKAGEVRIRLSLENRIGGAYDSKNVVAEIRGREKPDEIVLLGAHLDSWDLATGAQDDGVNDAMAIDVARAFKELNLRPRRTIRFVLFTGEEQGLWGSSGYVERHMAEMDRHTATVIYDFGSGRTSGFYLNGREELRGPVDEALRAGGLDSSKHTPEAFEGADNFGFLLAGVPNLVASQDPAPYLSIYHADSDTFDNVDRDGARSNDAVTAVLIWGLAERPARLAPRQTPAQVREVLKATKLDEAIEWLGLKEFQPGGKRRPRRK